MDNLLLLDASKAFDKLSFYTRLNILLDKKMCLRHALLNYCIICIRINHVMSLGLIIVLKH